MKHNHFSKLSVLCLCYLIMSPHNIMANIDHDTIKHLGIGLELVEMSKDPLKFSKRISEVTAHFENKYDQIIKVNEDLLAQLKTAYEQQAKFKSDKTIYASVATTTLVMAGILIPGGYAIAGGLSLVAGTGSTILNAKCTVENGQVVNSIKDNVVNMTANLKSHVNHINNILTKLNKHGKYTDSEKHAILILIMALHQNMSQFVAPPSSNSAPPMTLELPELAESISSFLMANPEYMSHFEFLKKIPVTPQLVGGVALLAALATVVEAVYAVSQTSDAVIAIEEVKGVFEQCETSLKEIVKFLNEINITVLRSGVKDKRKTDL